MKAYDLLHSIFGIPKLDADFIYDEAENFKIPLYDLDKGRTNEIIESIYTQAIARYTDKNEEDFEIFTNCLDSHLYYKGEEIYSYDDLVKIK